MTAPARFDYSPDQIRSALKRLPYRSSLKSRALDRQQRPGPRRDRNPAEEAWCSEADLVRALEDLPERRRKAVSMHVMLGFSLRAVGNELGVSHATIGRECQLGLEQMAASLGWEGSQS